MNEGRRKLYFYADRTSADRVKELYVRRGADVALVFAFLDRYAPSIDRTGIWTQSVASLALDLGWEDIDDLTQIVCSLADYGIRFDPEAEIFLCMDVAEQYWSTQGRSTNSRKGVANHLSRLPKSPLSDQVLAVWGLDKDHDIPGTSAENPFGAKAKPVSARNVAPLSAGGEQ
ncbi:hypothetical protein N9S00_07030 [Luminiphilus sp.]|nr:hypothetical protein [Luminiphilus sp.]